MSLLKKTENSYLFSWVWLITIIISFLSLYQVVINKNISIMIELDFSSFSLFPFSVPIVLDFYSMIFSITVLTISSWVALFSIFYMSHDPYGSRFISVLMLFVAAMNALIFIPSILGMMLGWDGLGVVSFLLVIYYSNSESLAAGMITALSNRIGDSLFILFLGFNTVVSSWHFSDSFLGIFQLSMLWLLMVGSMTKSAQIPFSAWLPAAMAAPTPVSTLVHSSTLVTAGVYVLFRFSACMSGLPMFFLMVSSTMTLLMAGMSATMESDLKKIVALSTLSQLGVMLFALSNSIQNICFFHLITHAYFKATMFLCVGTLIFTGSGLQDYRFAGKSWYKMPVVSSWLIVCCSCLSGLPFTSGFFSKDLIVESCLWNDMGSIGVIYTFFSVLLTAMYSMRMVIMIAFSKSFNSAESINDKSHLYATIPVTMMGLLALTSGWALQTSMLQLNHYIFSPGVYKNMTIVMVMIGMILSILIYIIIKKPFIMKNNFFTWFIKKMWFLTEISGNPISSNLLSTSMKIYRSLEKSWVSWFWKSSIKMTIYNLNYGVRKSQAQMMGKIMLLSMILFIIFIILK
nr:NADH dehydrogenase subunit 5 [Mytilopsis leucophaeata]